MMAGHCAPRHRAGEPTVVTHRLHEFDLYVAPLPEGIVQVQLESLAVSFRLHRDHAEVEEWTRTEQGRMSARRGFDIVNNI